MKNTGDDAGAGREKAVLENLWISSENDYYGTTFKFHLDSEEMMDYAP